MLVHHMLCLLVFVFFFFKQKTAYEMRISDWSSDVCSSDLIPDILLFDIGGGSTEICWLKTQPAGAAGAGSVAGQAPALSLYAWLSVPIGVITLSERYRTERYGTGRKVSGADAATSYRAMEADMAAAVAVFEARHRVRETVARGPVQMLGTSGTVTTLAGVQIGRAHV